MKPEVQPSVLSRQSRHWKLTGTLTCLFLLCLLANPNLGGAGQFERVLQPGWTNQSCYSWAASWGDYNGDGYPDLHICNTTLSYGPYVNFVYRNNGANTNAGPFTQMTTNELGEVVGNVAISYGSTWIDANNDGLLDLAVVRAPQNASSGPVASRLYLNQGGGKLVSVPAGAWTLPTFALGGTWGDYDNDGWLDFYELSAWATDPVNWPMIQTNRLFRGKADLRFEEIKNSVISTTKVQLVNNSLWSDYDNDGDVDLVVVNIGEPVSFFQNQGDGDFVGLTNTVTERLDGYNSAWGDYDNDGDLDLAIVGSATSVLYRNNYPDDFTIALDLHEANGYPTWADYDNDGLLDLLITRGQGSSMRNSLLHNNGDGTFTSVSDAMTTPGRWMCGAWGDYDNDGAMDLLVASSIGANTLFHNLGNSNHWIKFNLKGTVSNGSAIGAKVRVKATIRGQTVWQMREIQSGPASQAQDDMRPNFGLGDATNVELVHIEWPSGNVQELANQVPDRILNVTEPVRINPVRPTASLGGNVTLTNVSGGVSYQWHLDGANLVGKTARTLSLVDLAAADAGRYSVVVTLSNGTVLTNYTYVNVDTQFTKITSGPVVTDVGPGFWEAPNWWDYDNDGYLDLFIAQSSGNQQARAAVYHNNRDGSFTRATNAITTQVRLGWLGAVGDYNNDGNDDLLYARFSGADDLFRNEGGGTFSRQTMGQAGPLVGDADDTTAAGWADYDRDGFIDLFAANSFYGSAKPARNDCLYHNNGDGSFTRVTTNQVGMLVGDSVPTGPCSWADYDNDGWPDLWVGSSNADWPANVGRQYLWHNNGNGTFSRASAGSLDLNLAKGFGLWGDYDNDGYLDLFLTSWSGRTSLHRNLGGETFSDVSATAGVGKATETGLAAWGDYDNDGFLDLFLVAYTSPSILYRNNGDGTFASVDVGSPLRDSPTGGCVAWADYDNDGFLDLLITPEAVTQNLLYRNNGNSNAWLKLKLVGTTSNRSAIGAKARVQAGIRGKTIWQMREITGNSGMDGGAGGLVAHFGLGDATNVTTLRIEWPSGTVQELSNVPAKQMLTIVEPRRPVLTVKVTGTGVNGSLRADPNSTYQMQMSGDLTTWNNQGTVTTDAQGVGTWSDSGAAGVSHRFYRARGL